MDENYSHSDEKHVWRWGGYPSWGLQYSQNMVTVENKKSSLHSELLSCCISWTREQPTNHTEPVAWVQSYPRYAWNSSSREGLLAWTTASVGFQQFLVCRSPSSGGLLSLHPLTKERWVNPAKTKLPCRKWANSLQIWNTLKRAAFNDPVIPDPQAAHTERWRAQRIMHGYFF